MSLPVSNSSLPAPVSANGAAPLPYHFADHLPALYQTPDGQFLRDFLAGLEYLWQPIESVLDDPSALFDTRKAPADFLPWLASWIGMVLYADWPENQKRQLLREAVKLYQWRGTRKGIEKFLEIYTGLRPQIAEPFQGSVIGAETVIGFNAVIGDVPEHCFVVTAFIPDGEDTDERHLRLILDAEKPAHTAYRLRVERRAALRTSGPSEAR